MNKKQLSEHIGNIDDRLIEQAQKTPDYRRQRRQKAIRRLASTAAVITLMIGSFSTGALVFAREVVIEVPAAQETVTLDEINLTMVLPSSWHGKYHVDKYDQNYIVYNTQIREAVSEGIDAFDGGVLFYIVCYDESMTPEQFVENGYDFTGYRYLFSTSNHTYILHYASDVQWDPADPAQEAIYQQMGSEIKDIQFVVGNVLAD